MPDCVHDKKPAGILDVVLYQPRIPQNTGNIARTCAAAGAGLHLIRPLGFFMDDRRLKRAGMDYWNKVSLNIHNSLEEFFSSCPGGKFAYLTKKASRTYDTLDASGSLFLVFGMETEGLPESLLKNNRERCYRIPMKEGARSLNVSNAAAIVIYEVLRKRGFSGLRKHGLLK